MPGEGIEPSWVEPPEFCIPHASGARTPALTSSAASSDRNAVLRPALLPAKERLRQGTSVANAVAWTASEDRTSGGCNGKRNLHDQAAVRGVRGGYGAVVQAQVSLGDGQADARPTALPVAGVGHPVEREKQLGESALGNARATVADADDRIARLCAAPADRDVHLRVVLRDVVLREVHGVEERPC